MDSSVVVGTGTTNNQVTFAAPDTSKSTAYKGSPLEAIETSPRMPKRSCLKKQQKSLFEYAINLLCGAVKFLISTSSEKVSFALPATEEGGRAKIFSTTDEPVPGEHGKHKVHAPREDRVFVKRSERKALYRQFSETLKTQPPSKDTLKATQEALTERLKKLDNMLDDEQVLFAACGINYQEEAAELSKNTQDDPDYEYGEAPYFYEDDALRVYDRGLRTGLPLKTGFLPNQPAVYTPRPFDYVQACRLNTPDLMIRDNIASQSLWKRFQKAMYDIAQTCTATMKGMEPGAALTYLEQTAERLAPAVISFAQLLKSMKELESLLSSSYNARHMAIWLSTHKNKGELLETLLIIKKKLGITERGDLNPTKKDPSHRKAALMDAEIFEPGYFDEHIREAVQERQRAGTLDLKSDLLKFCCQTLGTTPEELLKNYGSP